MKLSASHPEKNYKWMFQLSAGPSVLFFYNISNYDVSISFEGLYQVDTVTQNKMTYYDYFDEGSTWNVMVTQSGINNQSTNPGAAAVYQLLDDRSYDFAASKNYRGKQSGLTRTTIGINLNFDAAYLISKTFKLKYGLGMLYAPMKEKSGEYKPMDKTTDTYNSIYNGKAQSDYFMLNLTAGIIYDF